MDDELSELLEEQARYYRACAATYDLAAEWASDRPDVRGSVQPVYDWFADLPIRGQVLEPACGTGLWTQRLARRADHVHALDAAPEMVERARDRVAGAGNVTFEVADLYRWQPSAVYDVVFLSFLLTHVPPVLSPRFWQVVSSSIASGGTIAFVDDAPRRQEVEDWVSEGVVRRVLPDGSEYRIVKVLPSPQEIVESMAQQGLEAEVDVLSDAFIVGSGRRAAVNPSPGGSS